MEPDWVARGIAIAAAGAAATNVIFTALTYRRVRPKVKVSLFRAGVRTGTERNPEASDYMFILRFRNAGTTPVKVERIELVAYPRWYKSKNPELVKGKRFHAGHDEPPVVPALDGVTHPFYLPTGRLTDPEERKHLRFRVLLSNGESIVSPKLEDDEWLLPDD
ncbi:hypothetical protein [Streptomyces curacoi]|uniref:Uncharacterized protein n=1 Tax=Streptomyces curacoi TaxID=146536 RepID=A0A124H5V1_9ACTN|nr:hypothetical protein [Streptomyces curacoi]KUM79743.1 hypothetical protein AQI70_05980 [Streptomyces curacoi]